MPSTSMGHLKTPVVGVAVVPLHGDSDDLAGLEIVLDGPNLDAEADDCQECVAKPFVERNFFRRPAFFMQTE